MLIGTWLFADVPDINLKPDAGGLPGYSVFQDLAGGVMFWALALCALAMILGLVTWAFASWKNNHHYAANGKQGAAVSGLAALLIGAAPALVNFFAELGDQVR
jgi:Family of unknown function (DUF6112)